jgi:hypothetical protein
MLSGGCDQGDLQALVSSDNDGKMLASTFTYDSG